MKKVLIYVKGGIVQWTASNDAETNIIVVDADMDNEQEPYAVHGGTADIVTDDFKNCPEIDSEIRNVLKTPTERYPEYDHLNHIDLRSDIENDLIGNDQLMPIGKCSVRHECWEIERIAPWGFADCYLYDNEAEYEEDLKILKLKK